MEIKKEDFVKYRIVDTFFYALPPSYFENMNEQGQIIEEVIDEELEVQKEKDAKLLEEMKLEKEKADKKAALIAELAALEE